MSVTRSGAWVSATRTGRFLVVVPHRRWFKLLPRGLVRAVVVLVAAALFLCTGCARSGEAAAGRAPGAAAAGGDT